PPGGGGGEGAGGAARGDDRGRGRRAPRRSATALPDGPRVARRPARGGSPGSGPVRFRPPGPRRPERPALGPGRSPEPHEQALPRRSGAGPGRLSVPSLSVLLAGVSGPPAERPGAATVPPSDMD